MIFTGEINGNLISKRRVEEEWVPYKLKFKRVLAYFSCKMDTYELLAGTDHLDSSDFDVIEESSWLKSLPVRSDFDKNIYKHYHLFTYDVVYNIIAVSYDLAAACKV